MTTKAFHLPTASAAAALSLFAFGSFAAAKGLECSSFSAAAAPRPAPPRPLSATPLTPASAVDFFWSGAAAAERPVADGVAISLAELPLYTGPTRVAQIVRGWDELPAWREVVRTLWQGGDAANEGLDAASAQSVASVGRAELTFASLRDQSALESPSALRLARLPSGQPVAAVPFVVGARGYDELLIRMAMASLSGAGGRFYGIQRIDDRQAMALMELPKPGHFLGAPGGEAHFTRNVYRDAARFARALVAHGYRIDHGYFDLRPFATFRGGGLALLPDGLARYGDARTQALVNAGHQARAATLGVALTAPGLDRLYGQVVARSLETAIAPYLSAFARSGASVDELRVAAGDFDGPRLARELRDLATSIPAEASSVERVLAALEAQPTIGPDAFGFDEKGEIQLVPLAIGQTIGLAPAGPTIAESPVRFPTVGRIERIEPISAGAYAYAVTVGETWRSDVGALSRPSRVRLNLPRNLGQGLRFTPTIVVFDPAAQSVLPLFHAP